VRSAIQSRTRESNVAAYKIGTVLGIVCWILHCRCAVVAELF